MSQDADPSDSDVSPASLIDLTPEKTGLLDTLPADLDIPGALKEIVDNSLDAWERVAPPFDHLTIEIEYDEDEEMLIIRDNAGGVGPGDVKRFFALGSSNPGSGVQTRGAYGVGLKKAALRLSSEITFATRYYDQDGDDETGHGFTITEEWLQKDDDWEVEPETFDIEPGTTEIRLRQLDFEWEEEFMDIRTELRSAYRRQLGGGPFNEERQITIKIDGDSLQPPRQINYGFPALDGLHPREFVAEVDHPQLDAPLNVRIAVGLLAEKRNEEAGTDVYIQGRLVHETAQNEQGGFGVDNGHRQFNTASRGRFRAAISIESNAPAEQLPWNTTKDRLFADDPVMKGVWDLFRRTTDRYYDAVFGEVPQAFLRFPADHQWAYNDGEIEVAGDQTNRDRITAKPKKNYPEVQTVRNHAEAHAKLGIYFADAVVSDDDPEVKRHQKREAYKSILTDNFEAVGDLRNPSSINGIPPDFAEYDDINAGAIVDELKSDAQQHVQAGVRYVGHEPWKQPLYDAFLEELSDDRSELEDVDERPDIDDDDGSPTDGTDSDPDTSTRRNLAISVTDEEFGILQDEFGDIEADSPEERGRKLMELINRIRIIRSPVDASD